MPTRKNGKPSRQSTASNQAAQKIVGVKNKRQSLKATALFADPVASARLDQNQRAAFVDMVDALVDQYGPRLAADLRTEASFVADSAASMDDAINQMAKRLEKADEETRVAWHRSKLARDGISTSEYILNQLVADGRSFESIAGRFLAPFRNGKGEIPSQLVAAAHFLLSEALSLKPARNPALNQLLDQADDGFAPGKLENIIPDGLFLELAEAGNRTDALAAAYSRSTAIEHIVRRIEQYLVSNLNFGTGNYYDATPSEIPHVVNFFWSGREMSKYALENVLTWAKKANGTGWQVRMWSDLEISKWSANARKRLAAAGVEIQEARTRIDPRLTAAYEGARQANLASASDFFRLSMLQADGGIYVDVDIAPGGIDLNSLSYQASQQSIPIFAPMLRDARNVREVLGLQPDQEVTPGDVRQAAAIQTRLGLVNGNFIAVQQGSMFLDPIINHIAGKLDRILAIDEAFWYEAKDSIAGITGPGPLLGVLAEMVAIRDNVTLDQAHEYLTANVVCDWPLGWVTAESENQNWTLRAK